MRAVEFLISEAEYKNFVFLEIRGDQRLLEAALHQLVANVLVVSVLLPQVFKIADAADFVPAKKDGVGKAQDFVNAFRVAA